MGRRERKRPDTEKSGSWAREEEQKRGGQVSEVPAEVTPAWERLRERVVESRWRESECVLNTLPF